MKETRAVPKNKMIDHPRLAAFKVAVDANVDDVAEYILDEWYVIVEEEIYKDCDTNEEMKARTEYVKYHAQVWTFCAVDTYLTYELKTKWEIPVYDDSLFKRYTLAMIAAICDNVLFENKPNTRSTQFEAALYLKMEIYKRIKSKIQSSLDDILKKSLN